MRTKADIQWESTIICAWPDPVNGSTIIEFTDEAGPSNVTFSKPSGLVMGTLHSVSCPLLLPIKYTFSPTHSYAMASTVALLSN